MRKYVAAALLELKSIHAYRLNWTLSVLCELIPLAGALVFWQAFFGERAEPLYGYASQQVTTYYFLAAVLTGWVPTVWHEVSHNILSGTLDIHLARPIGYSHFYLARQLASNAYFLLWTAALMLPIVLVSPALVAGPASVPRLVLFVCALVLGYVLEYTLQVAIHGLTFWFGNISGFLGVYWLLGGLLAGRYFPLDFLPHGLYTALQFTPFWYPFFFPMQLYLGRIPMEQLALRSVVGLVWIGLLIWVRNWLWEKGLRRYQGAGS